MNISIIKKELLSDLTTPVSLYLKLREQYAEVLLLESSDYSSKENSLSFLCFDSLATLQVDDGTTKTTLHTSGSVNTKPTTDVVADVQAFVNSFQVDTVLPYSGVFGYTSFDAIQYFDSHQLDSSKQQYGTPDIRYDFFRYVIVFDHFYERMTIIEHLPEGESSTIDKVVNVVRKQDSQTYYFRADTELKQNMSDQAFMDIVTKCKEQCQLGNVFQIVPARRFSKSFSGDEFNVYRALRSINPSPYLYYFDYGAYKIFGSSPEAHIIVKNGKSMSKN